MKLVINLPESAVSEECQKDSKLIAEDYNSPDSESIFRFWIIGFSL
jgi:hypothetical protein